MDVVHEVAGRFRITYIPYVSDRPLREPFLLHYRGDDDVTAEAVQLPRDLFGAIVGCPTPDLINAFRPYMVERYAMSNGMLSQLLAAPRSLAELATSVKGAPMHGVQNREWSTGAPSAKGIYLWRSVKGEREYTVEVRDQKVWDSRIAPRIERVYDGDPIPSASYEDMNRGQWHFLYADKAQFN